MSKFTCSHTYKNQESFCRYELKMGEQYSFFKIVVQHDGKEVEGLISPEEAELLVVALNHFINNKKKAAR
jgi:hypothetical protein